jgi:hypothetical protein
MQFKSTPKVVTDALWGRYLRLDLHVIMGFVGITDKCRVHLFIPLATIPRLKVFTGRAVDSLYLSLAVTLGQDLDLLTCL